MNSWFCLAVLLSLATTTSALKIRESFLNKAEIDHFRGRIPVVSGKQQKSGPARRHGAASLPASLARRMISSVCEHDVCTNGCIIDFDFEVRTSLIGRSTPVHVDHFSNGEAVHQHVGFVFLNDNPDAYFQHGKNSVPVKAGNLVTFKGDVTHNTVVKNGQVALLGPFDMVNFNAVGMTNFTCCGEEFLEESLSFFDDCQGQCSCDLSNRDNSTCCGVVIIDDCEGTFADTCTAACNDPSNCETVDCCGTDVFTRLSDDDFTRACNLACSREEPNPDTCCGKSPPLIKLTTKEKYAKKCTKKCEESSTCFSETNIVEVQGRGHISMDSLKIGDFVRAGKNQFSRVFSFIHLDRDVETDFLQIHTDELKDPLEVSQDHMVFVQGTPVRASQIKIKDLLGDQHTVTQIQVVKRRGVYAPVTESGDIMVSGIVASCYAAPRSHTPVPQQNFEAHALFAMRRLACRINFGICKGETYTEEGFPEWLSPLIHFALSTKNNATAKFFASVVGLPLVATVYLMEQALTYQSLVVGVLILAGFIAFKNKTKSSKTRAL